MLSTIDVVPFCIENFPLQLDNFLSTGGTNDIVALMIALFKSQHDQFLTVVAVVAQRLYSRISFNRH